MRRVREIPKGRWEYYINTPKHPDHVRLRGVDPYDGSSVYVDVQRSIWEAYKETEETE